MRSSHAPHRSLQFSLRFLFEYTTFCCLLAALSNALGIGPCLCLMAFGLALIGKQGLLALALLAIAFGSTELNGTADSSGAYGRLILTLLAAALLSLWFRWRGHHLPKP